MRVASVLLPLVLLSGCALFDGQVRQVYQALGSFELSCGPVTDGDRCQRLGYQGAERFQRQMPDLSIETVELREGPDEQIVAWVCGSRAEAAPICSAQAVK